MKREDQSKYFKHEMRNVCALSTIFRSIIASVRVSFSSSSQRVGGRGEEKGVGEKEIGTGREREKKRARGKKRRGRKRERDRGRKIQKIKIN